MLKSLRVANCRSMEEVVAKTEEEINNVNAESYVVSFPNLVSIELYFLNNLCCLCQQPYAFEFPFLETLQIRKCPKLQTFITANKPPKTPNLMGVQLDDKYMEILEQDLNGTIRHCFEANQTFVTANKTPKIPKLEVVNLNGKDMEILEQDLNGIIRRQFEKPE
ncbi:uncharacterized protein LOC132799817 [Ziziphus jujuba]|uniref:Uncharacterized protein LOC132799817 n=1 Tax=Ziziphus jujuba TaxID=326968 RepID=A0ABM3ZVN4_ZIZJJ|nr:uncharacterized protein LOC132799817 [Ziziphus jujuba]